MLNGLILVDLQYLINLGECIMLFSVTIKVDNDAYHNQPVQYQLIDNLKDIIAKLEDANDWGIVRDVNGNKVGDWGLE
jgi:hypothetical protein